MIKRGERDQDREQWREPNSHPEGENSPAMTVAPVTQYLIRPAAMLLFILFSAVSSIIILI